MMKADLHVHTNHTDCSESPDTVFNMAKDNGVTTIAITDHDTLYGIEILSELADKHGIDYIPGIEISAYDYKNNKKCHIVGLFVEKGYKPLDNMIEMVTEERRRAGIRQIRRLSELGFEIGMNDFEDLNCIHGIYKQHIMDVLIRKGYAREIYGEFYEKMFKNDGPVQMSINYPSHLEAVKVLSDAGGLPVLAHPGLYYNFDSVEDLVKNGLRGIEVSYPKVTDEDITIIKELAEKYNLFLSGGSDYHGSYSGHDDGYVGSHFITSLNLA